MSYTPFLLVFHITGKCNLNCVYCYADSYENENMKLEDAKDVLNQAENLGSKHVIFTGGESFIHPNFQEIMEYAHELAFDIHITSNGSLINKKWADKLKSMDVKVTISLDGSSSGINDPLRGDGTFEMALNAIKTLVNYDIYTSMRMTLVKDNVSDVSNYLEFAIDNGVNRCIIERMTLMENMPESKILEPSIEDVVAVFKVMSEYQNIDDLLVGTNDPLWLVFREKEITKHLNKDYLCGGCTAGVAAISVNPNLTVTPCPRLPINAGDLKKDSMEDIWNESEVFNNLRNRDLFEGCVSCRFKYVCGGCRGSAYAHGSYLGKDPHCWRLIDELRNDGH